MLFGGRSQDDVTTSLQIRLRLRRCSIPDDRQAFALHHTKFDASLQGNEQIFRYPRSLVT
jgi:hypothetical protein